MKKQRILKMLLNYLQMMLTVYEDVQLSCSVCRQEGQQHGEGGDQGVPGEQEDLSGSGGTSYR